MSLSASWGYIAIGLVNIIFFNRKQNNIFCKQKSNEMKSLFFSWNITELSARLIAYVCIIIDEQSGILNIVAYPCR